MPSQPSHPELSRLSRPKPSRPSRPKPSRPSRPEPSRPSSPEPSRPSRPSSVVGHRRHQSSLVVGQLIDCCVKPLLLLVIVIGRCRLSSSSVIVIGHHRRSSSSVVVIVGQPSDCCVKPFPLHPPANTQNHCCQMSLSSWVISLFIVGHLVGRHLCWSLLSSIIAVISCRCWSSSLVVIPVAAYFCSDGGRCRSTCPRPARVGSAPSPPSTVDGGHHRHGGIGIDGASARRWQRCPSADGVTSRGGGDRR